MEGKPVGKAKRVVTKQPVEQSLQVDERIHLLANIIIEILDEERTNSGVASYAESTG